MGDRHSYSDGIFKVSELTFIARLLPPPSPDASQRGAAGASPPARAVSSACVVGTRATENGAKPPPKCRIRLTRMPLPGVRRAKAALFQWVKAPPGNRSSLEQWCTNVMRSKVEPMKDVARMIRKHFEGIIAWSQTRQINGFLEAINGLFQAAKRRARGYTNFETMRTVLFLIAGKLDFTSINPHTA